MPPRYKQSKLDSSLVGTPGVDASAGAAEGKLSQTLANTAAQQDAFTMQRLNQAEQNLDSARQQSFYMQRDQDAQQHATDNAIQALDIQNAKERFEIDLMLKKNELSERFAKDPKSIIPNLREYAQQQITNATDSISDPKMQALIGKTLKGTTTSVEASVARAIPEMEKARALANFTQTKISAIDAARRLGSVGDIESLDALALAQTTKGALLSASLISPEGPAKAVELREDILAEGLNALGMIDPELAQRRANAYVKAGAISATKAQKLAGDLQQSFDRVVRLNEQQKAKDIRVAKESFTNQFTLEMQLARGNANLDTSSKLALVEDIWHKATQTVADAKRSGASPEILDALNTELSQANSVRESTLRTEVFEPAKLQDLQRKADILKVHQDQAGPEGGRLVSDAFAGLKFMERMVNAKGVDLKDKINAVARAKASVMAAHAVMDTPGSGAHNFNAAIGAIKAEEMRLGQMEQKILDNRRKNPLAAATDSFRDAVASTTGDSKTLHATTFSGAPLSQSLVKAWTSQQPGLNEDSIRKELGMLLAQDMEKTLRKNPNFRFTKENMLAGWRAIQERELKSTLQESARTPYAPPVPAQGGLVPPPPPTAPSSLPTEYFQQQAADIPVEVLEAELARRKKR